MKRSVVAITIGFSVALLCGCNVGMAPQGPDAAQVQEEFSKLTPQQQINGILHSPLPADEKEKKIQEIEQKYGVKREGSDSTSLPGR